MNLNEYDLIVVNSSAGKDSLAALFRIITMADEQGYPRQRIHVSHQDLGHIEWPGTKELAEEQANLFGLQFHVVARRRKDGSTESILDYAERRGKWPSNKQRWCTSDFKRAPGARVVTALTAGMAKSKILYVFGFRAEESPARSKKEVLKLNTMLTTKSREVWDYLPIHDWTVDKVWSTIKGNNLPYHPAYDKGMPRLSCMFCIFSPKSALMIAGRENPALLDEYIRVEDKIGHTFRDKFSLREVKDAIESGEESEVLDWVM